MKRPFDSWASEFSFSEELQSEELQTLEKQLSYTDFPPPGVSLSELEKAEHQQREYEEAMSLQDLLTPPAELMRKKSTNRPASHGQTAQDLATPHPEEDSQQTYPKQGHTGPTPPPSLRLGEHPLAAPRLGMERPQGRPTQASPEQAEYEQARAATTTVADKPATTFRRKQPSMAMAPSGVLPMPARSPERPSVPLDQAIMMKEGRQPSGDVAQLEAARNNVRQYMSPRAQQENLQESMRDQAVLDRFVEQVSQALIKRMSEDAFLEQFLSVSELKRDNEILASQVRRMLQERARYQAELRRMEELMQRYKPVFGNVYLKVES
jgi:hypothetical protein